MSRGLERRGAVLGGAIAAAAILAFSLLSRADPGQPGYALAAFAIVILAGALGMLALHEPARAVESVTHAAERVAEGRLGETVDAAGGQAGELATAFNTMTRRVEDLFRAVAADQARLEAVFEASADAMVAVSHDAHLQFLNRAAESLFGASRAAALGRPFIESARDYELDAIVRRALAGDARGESSVVTFGARRLPVRAAAVPIPAGGDWAVLLVLTDLTEVQRVDQMRRDFIANVSHELRTPLAAIRALAETMASGAVEPGEETDEFLARIQQQAERLTQLVNELLDLSRIESGAADLHPEQVDLAALIAEVVSLLRTRADERRIRVVAPSAPGATAEADRAALQRAVSNLLDNALKFSPDEATVTVDLRDEGQLIAISVQDHGPGILPHDLPRVFERFYKGDTSRSAGGAGLGLAIVKHIVRNHGGTVEAQSEAGDGSVFTIRLPRHFVGVRADPVRPRRIIGPAA